MLNLSRMLGYHATEDDTTGGRLGMIERRLHYYVSLPGAILVFVTGLLMLHGFNARGGGSPGDYLRGYLAPRMDGEPSYWYVTFHIKIVTAVLLVGWHVFIGREIKRIVMRTLPGSGIFFAVMSALTLFVAGLMGIWLTLQLGGTDPTRARYIGYGVGLALAAGGAFAGKRIGAVPGRARFSALHGMIAMLVIINVILVVARPLANGGQVPETPIPAGDVIDQPTDAE